MWNGGLHEAQAGIKIVKININNLRYADDTTLMEESKKELKSLLMKVKKRVKGLKLNLQKNKVITPSPISSVQSLSHVWLFATPWTSTRQVSLSITNSRSPPKPISIVSVMPSNHLMLCHPLLLPSIFLSIRVFSNESVLHIRWPSIGVSASASVLPMNTQDWSPLGWTGWISLQSKGLSRVFNTIVQKHQFFCTQLPL